jgi:hypothetical protein
MKGFDLKCFIGILMCLNKSDPELAILLPYQRSKSLAPFPAHREW